MKKQIITEITINASVEAVWKVFTDFQAYSEWNPFIKSLTGDVAQGNKLKVMIQPPNSKPMTFKPKVLEFEKNKVLRWIGKMMIPGIFDGEHTFELRDNGDGTTQFLQGENFKGILVGTMKKQLDGNVTDGFNNMNMALKQRVENQKLN